MIIACKTSNDTWACYMSTYEGNITHLRYFDDTLLGFHEIKKNINMEQSFPV